MNKIDTREMVKGGCTWWGCVKLIVKAINEIIDHLEKDKDLQSGCKYTPYKADPRDTVRPDIVAGPFDE